jgi:hypothetical protein
MTTWDSQTTSETGWQTQDVFIQLITHIDNEYPINYSLVDINGRTIEKWANVALSETGWNYESS